MSMPSLTDEGRETDTAMPLNWLTCNVPKCGYRFRLKSCFAIDMKDFHFHKNTHTISELLGTTEAPSDEGKE